MDRAGREEGAACALESCGVFSGTGRVGPTEGALACDDVRDVLLPVGVPEDESFVRRLALRERCWTEAPISPSVDEMLWRVECLRRGGVEGGLRGVAAERPAEGAAWSPFWSKACWMSVSALAMGDTGGRLMVGGSEAGVGALGAGLLEVCLKNEGRRLKMLAWLCSAMMRAVGSPDVGRVYVPREAGMQSSTSPAGAGVVGHGQ